jgi:hypothetical protein
MILHGVGMSELAECMMLHGLGLFVVVLYRRELHDTECMILHGVGMSELAECMMLHGLGLFVLVLSRRRATRY